MLSIGLPAHGRKANELRGVHTHYVMQPFTSRADWETRRAVLRKQILNAAGLHPMPPKASLHIQYVRHVENELCSVDTLLFEPLPGFQVGANLYRPLKHFKKAPAVLISHGHWKKGRLENKPEYSVPALGMNLAHQGYVALAFDMVGYNDASQLPHDFVTRAGQLWSYSPMGIQLWTGIRALDLLISLPYVDENRVAATGASGGGTHTFLLTAVDDRVKYSAPVNMVSAYMQGGDPCEEAPGLRVDTFNVEIAALAAPRPMHLVSCTEDWTKHTPDEEYPEVRRIYELYGRSADVGNTHVESKHNYNAASRMAVYGFLARYLEPSLAGTDLKDIDIGEIRDEDFLASPPKDSSTLNADQLFLQWKNMAREQSEQTRDKEQLRDRLRLALHAEYPRIVESSIEGERVELWSPVTPNRVTAHWRPGKRDPVLIVNPGGMQAARGSALVKNLMETDRPILILDDFQPPPDRTQAESDRNFYSYNLPDGSIRVQNILTALVFLKSHASGKPQIIGTGAGGVWSLFAAAVAPVETDLIADINGFGGTDEDFLSAFFVPGIQRAGGLQAALRLTNTIHTVARFERDPAQLRISEPSLRIRGRRLLR